MKRIIFVLFVFVLSACANQPSESDIQTAIAQTQEANPAFTNTVEPTETPTNTVSNTPTNTPTDVPTETKTPTPTETLTPSPTPSPTPDMRIITGDPYDFILVENDLPDRYYLKRGYSSPHINKEILSGWGIEEGKAYLEATGRIGGWVIYYILGSPTAIAPEWIRSIIVMYDNVDGPDILNEPEWDQQYADKVRDGIWEPINYEMELGDDNRVYIRRKRQPNGKYKVWYFIEFWYRNVWASVSGYGWEPDVNHDYLENAAREILTKLEAAPLTNP